MSEQPFQKQFENVQTIPGTKSTAAASILAEVGVDMHQFPTSHHRASWAGICPGNNESAGKHKSTRVRQGDTWLRGTLTESAWAASRKKNSSFAARFRRLLPTRGQKRSLVALGHNLCWLPTKCCLPANPIRNWGLPTWKNAPNRHASGTISVVSRHWARPPCAGWPDGLQFYPGPGSPRRGGCFRDKAELKHTLSNAG